MPRKSIPTPIEVATFRRRLLRWFRRHGRDLPWRRTRDPYHVLVSEVMLQQTQVSRVAGFYGAFLQEFPTLPDLAAAAPTVVRERWEGLGYYRRAANQHRLAQELVAQGGTTLPPDLDALQRLPGVGRYTAGAVLSFAFEQPAAAVDTNVSRVIRRVFHPRLPRGGRHEQRVWETAERLVPRRGAATWAFNQGIMELGALVCTARVKRCGSCPVREGCRSREE
ncbi:MAG: A/G-specific adenine glycosylase [Gemmatimonadales bacterium]